MCCFLVLSQQTKHNAPSWTDNPPANKDITTQASSALISLKDWQRRDNIVILPSKSFLDTKRHKFSFSTETEFPNCLRFEYETYVATGYVLTQLTGQSKIFQPRTVHKVQCDFSVTQILRLMCTWTFRFGNTMIELVRTMISSTLRSRNIKSLVAMAAMFVVVSEVLVTLHQHFARDLSRIHQTFLGIQTHLGSGWRPTLQSSKFGALNLFSDIRGPNFTGITDLFQLQNFVHVTKTIQTMLRLRLK